MKKEKTDYSGAIMVAVFLILIVIALVSFSIMRSQGSKCLINPVQYGVNQIAKQTGENVLVTVSSSKAYQTFSTNLNLTVDHERP